MDEELDGDFHNCIHHTLQDMSHTWQNTDIRLGFWTGNLKKETIVRPRRRWITLKCILKKGDGAAWTKSTWCRTAVSDGLL